MRWGWLGLAWLLALTVQADTLTGRVVGIAAVGLAPWGEGAETAGATGSIDDPIRSCGALRGETYLW